MTRTVRLWNGQRASTDDATLFVPKDHETGEVGEPVYIYSDADKQEEAEEVAPLLSVWR